MSEPTTNSLDPIDREILAILQTDGRLSGAEIGRKVNLSQPAVSARIQRLERSGVITGYQAVVDPARIGLNIHAAVRVRTMHARIPEALELFAGLPEVTATYRLTGEDCFLLDVHTPDAGRLEQVVDAIGRLGPVSTSLVLRNYPSLSRRDEEFPARYGDLRLAGCVARDRSRRRGAGRCHPVLPGVDRFSLAAAE